MLTIEDPLNEFISFFHLETDRSTDVEMESLLHQKKRRPRPYVSSSNSLDVAEEDEPEVGSDNDNYDPYSNEDDSEKAQEGKERSERRTETKQTNKKEKERQETTV